MLTILAFGSIFVPFNHAAAQVASITGCGEGGCNSSWGAPQSYAPAGSGSCYYDSCNTNITNYYNGGNQQPAYQQTYQQSYPNYQQSYQSAYPPSQVAYVPPVQQNIVYAPTPVIPTNVVYSTSLNPNPPTTVTRVVTRTVTTPSSGSSSQSTTSGTTGTTNSTTPTTDNGNNGSNLASNAIFGSSGFLPSGLIQWVLFGIFVLIIIILARTIFGAKTAYEEMPMKYE